jgi:hypothetical protein
MMINRMIQRAHDDAMRAIAMQRAHETRDARIKRRMTQREYAIVQRDQRHAFAMIKLRALRAQRNAR